MCDLAIRGHISATQTSLLERYDSWSNQANLWRHLPYAVQKINHAHSKLEMKSSFCHILKAI